MDENCGWDDATELDGAENDNVINFSRLEVMATSLLKWTRRDFQLAEIKDLVENLNAWNEIHKQD